MITELELDTYDHYLNNLLINKFKIENIDISDDERSIIISDWKKGLDVLCRVLGHGYFDDGNMIDAVDYINEYILKIEER